MSIDYKQNTYVKIDNFTNVVNEVPNSKARVEGSQSIIYGQLWELIYKLALHHPEWQFVGEDSWFDSSKGAFVVKRFRIYEGPDVLGSVCIDTWRDTKFEIRNQRIHQAMAKRNHKSTKDVGKAVKIVEEFFKSKTLTERVSEARNAVSGAVSNQLWAATREFNNVMEKLAPALVTYVTLNLPTLRPILESYGAPSSALDMLIDKNEPRKVMESMNRARHNRTGTVVMLHGDKYVLMRDADPEPEIVAASQLTDDMRGKLGVLKIVDDNAAIESIGMRINATTFYLLP